jgi:hypothetical protein
MRVGTTTPLFAGGLDGGVDATDIYLEELVIRGLIGNQQGIV